MTKFLTPVPGAASGAQRRAFDAARATDILARTLYGEARGEAERGMAAVACVIMNRVHLSEQNMVNARGPLWWGRDVVSVCLKQYQFSCWNRDDPNRRKIIAVTRDDPIFAAALRIARAAISGEIEDVTHGATHYHARNITPTWARGVTPTATIGQHIFYKIS